MTEGDELLGQSGYDTLRTAVESRGNRFSQRRNLRDTHGIVLLTKNKIRRHAVGATRPLPIVESAARRQVPADCELALRNGATGPEPGCQA